MTPTSDPSNPSAHTISVAEGNSETMRGVALLIEMRLAVRARRRLARSVAGWRSRSLVVIAGYWDDRYLPGGQAVQNPAGHARLAE
ncbi:MAG: hypothetical protein ACRDTD_09875 [Pseudonocardiaceae bacterium]